MIAVVLVIAMVMLIGMVAAVGEVYDPVGDADELIHDPNRSRGMTVGAGLVSYHGLAQRYYTFRTNGNGGVPPTDLVIRPGNMTNFSLTNREGVAVDYSINRIPYMVGPRNNGGALTTPADLPYLSYVDLDGTLFTYINPARVTADNEMLAANGNPTGVNMTAVRSGAIRSAGQSLSIGVQGGSQFRSSFGFTTVNGFGGDPADCPPGNGGRCRVAPLPITMNPGGNAPNTALFTTVMPVQASRMR